MGEGALYARQVLESFDRAMDREVHNLARWPGTTWQQLSNRLRWEDEASALLERAPHPARPWARVRSPYAESSALLRTLSGHDFWVTACPVGPRADVVASTSTRSLVLWDIDTGEVRWTSDTGGAAAFSPDGSRIATAMNGADDGVAAIVDAKSGAVVVSSKEIRSRTVDACSFSPDGSLVATGHRSPYFTGGAVMVWDGATLEEILPGDTEWPEFSPVSNVCFTPDGARLIASDYRAVHAFDVPGGAVAWTLTGDRLGLGRIYACAVSPDGATVAAGGTGGGEVALIAAASGEVSARIGAAPGKIQSCAFAPDGSCIVLGKQGGGLELWDPRTGESLGELAGHANDVLSCAFSPDGASLVTGSRDQTVKVWDAASRSAEASAAAHAGEVSALVASPGGSYFLSGGEDGILCVWDPQTGEHTRSLPRPAEGAPPELQIFVDGDIAYAGGVPLPGIADCALSADASLALCVGAGRNLRTWDVATGRSIWTWHVDFPAGGRGPEVTGNEYPLYGCAVSPDQQFLISSGSDGAIRIWDLRTVEEVRVLSTHSTLHGCAVSPDGAFIVAAGLRGDVQVWDPAAGQIVRHVSLSGRWRDPGVRRCAVSPDAEYLVAVAESGPVGAWHSATGEPLFEPRWHDGDVHDCAVTPDAALIVTGGSDHTIRFWSADDGSEVMTLPVPGPVRALALHASLPILIWGDSGGNVMTAELNGIEYGPLATVPYHHTDGRLVARCPACRSLVAIRQAGYTFPCPGESCGAKIRATERIRQMLDWRPPKSETRRMKKEKAEEEKRRAEQPSVLDRLRKWGGGD